MFKRVRGKTKFMWLPVTVSTAFSEGDLVAWNTSAGTLIEATSTTAGNLIMGVLRHAIASTDDNYATARTVEVEVPVEKYVEWIADVGTGTPSATTDLGIYHDIDGGGEIDVDASSKDIFFATRYVDSTHMIGILNIGPESLGVAD
jgi:hypothetical protein